MDKISNSLVIAVVLLCALQVSAQEATPDYKQRVLESSEIDFLSSYYSQDGENAAVTGGKGTEELTDATATVIVSIPLNDDDILTIDAGVSAYTSASSSNVNPFDGNAQGDPFTATTGASRSDTWVNFTGSYSHSSDDRNNIWSARVSVSNEYDYSSFGFGGSYAKLFNEKNTELNVSTSVYLDKWKLIYPIELRPFTENGIGEFRSSEITGNTDYDPNFTELEKSNRNSYALGLGLSQILGKTLQGLLSLDVIQQQGLLSTPFQRVYFSDIADSFVENFQLADDIERLPDTRFKMALGGRLNWFVSPAVTLRSYYRYYFDDWGVSSHTASLEVPVKISDRFTLYPSYRFYNQTEADYFAVHEAHLSSEEFYTSDHDLSEYVAHQYGIGVSYTDIFTKIRISNIGLKSIDLKFYNYDRDTEFSSIIATGGFKFVFD